MPPPAASFELGTSEQLDGASRLNWRARTQMLRCQKEAARAYLDAREAGKELVGGRLGEEEEELELEEVDTIEQQQVDQLQSNHHHHHQHQHHQDHELVGLGSKHLSAPTEYDYNYQLQTTSKQQVGPRASLFQLDHEQQETSSRNRSVALEDSWAQTLDFEDDCSRQLSLKLRLANRMDTPNTTTASNHNNSKLNRGQTLGSRSRRTQPAGGAQPRQLQLSGQHQDFQCYGSPHWLTLEELKVTRNSCWLCGCNWQQDHVSLDCPECDGYALTRPCPSCDGRCQQVWRRNIRSTHDRHKADWEGQCSLKQVEGPKVEQQVASAAGAQKQRRPASSYCSSAASSDEDESSYCSTAATQHHCTCSN